MSHDTFGLHPDPYTINLADGEQLNYADAIHAPVSLHNVAHSLARQTRFTGHILTAPFYSVAEHAVLVSTILEKLYERPDLALAGLHHDDAEFATGDINKPLKQYMISQGFDIKKLERDLLVPISMEFGVPIDQFGDSLIHDADELAYCAESLVLKPKGHGPIPEEIEEGDFCKKVMSNLRGLDPESAEQAFILRHKQLSGGLRILTQVIEIAPDGEQAVRDPHEGEVEELRADLDDMKKWHLPPGLGEGGHGEDLGN